MHDDRFDAEIKRLLNNNIENDYDPKSWEQMNDRLDETDMKDVETHDLEFDNYIKTKINQYEAPHSDEDWIVLRNHLNQAEARRNKIFSSKILEAVVVLFLVLTIIKFKTLTKPQVELNAKYMAQITTLDIPIASLRHLSEPIYSLSLYNASNNFYDYNSPSYYISQPKSLTKTIQRETFKFSGLKKSLIISKPISIDALSDITVEIKKIPIKIIKPIAPSPIEYITVESANNSDGWSIGIPLSFDINFVNTSFNVSYLRSQFKNKLGGNSIGISTSYRKDAFEIESGIKYSQKEFAPALANYTKASANSYLLDELDAVTFHQIQLPLLIKAYPTSNKKINFYALCGITANVFVDINYAFTKTIQANARPSSLPYVNAIDLQDLPKGAINGGDIKDNIFITALLGAGMSIALSDDFSTSIQPQYQHTLGGDINEIASEINSLSLELGAKYKF